jgi:urease accessory protein
MMPVLIERVLGNVFDAPGGASASVGDVLPLSWETCLRRACGLGRRGGRDVRALLPPGVRVRHGDVLLRSPDGAALLAVEVEPCELLLARPPSAAEMATLAYELGNLHAPVQILGDRELLTIPDGPVEALLCDLAVPFQIVIRRFEPRHADGGVLSTGVSVTRVPAAGAAFT